MNLVDVVLAMALVTYIPRMLPPVLLQHVQLPKLVIRFMKFIPYSALGALIFPGILSSTGPDHFTAALAGTVAAGVLAWLELNLILIVAGGIAGAFIASML